MLEGSGLAKSGVIIPARNEEKYLGKTLEHLLSQKYKPDIVVVVDDGSSDKTAEIAKNNGAVVIQLPDRRYSVVGRPELAEVLNTGLRFLDDVGGFEYVMILGAEQLLPRDYIERTISQMEKNDKIVIASGRVAGEFSRAPRGSGRVYKFKFLREINFFPVNYGWESYPLVKALIMGYETRTFENLVTFGQRATKLSAQKLYFGGKGLKALGYDPVYVLWEFFLKFFESPRGALNILRGYFSTDVKRYPDVDVGAWQRRELPRKMFAKINRYLKQKK